MNRPSHVSWCTTARSTYGFNDMLDNHVMEIFPKSLSKLYFIGIGPHRRLPVKRRIYPFPSTVTLCTTSHEHVLVRSDG